MWSPSQAGGFPPGTPVSSHTKTIRTETSVPTSMVNIKLYNLLLNLNIDCPVNGTIGVCFMLTV